MNVVVDDSPGLHARLAAAHQKEQEAERRAEAAEVRAAKLAAAAGRAAALPSAEVLRLRVQLEAAAAEADMLRSQLAAVERERSPRRSGQLPGSGLAAELEDVDEGRVRQLEEQVGWVVRHQAAGGCHAAVM